MKMSLKGKASLSPLKDRKRMKKEKANAFKGKFKSMKVKKKDKEKVEKTKDKDKEKKDKKRYKRSASAGGESLQQLQPLQLPATEPVFGVTVELAVSRSRLVDGIELPRVFRDCIQYIEDKGLELEGIYRISGVKSKLDELRQKYDHGVDIDLDSYGDPHIIAGLLKLYLRDLPVNILTPKLLPVFDSCVGLKDSKEQVERFKRLLNELPLPNRTLLGWLFVHLKHVMDKPENKMNIQNISIVFSPTMNVTHGILHIFFCNVNELFPGVELARHVAGKSARNNGSNGQGVNSSPRTIQKQLVEEEDVLDKLHEKINREEPDEDDDLMEEIWERQRRVTQLKRKLKALRRAEVTRPILESDDKQSVVVMHQTVSLQSHPDAVDGQPEKQDDNCNDIKDLLFEQKRLLYEQEEIANVTKYLQEKIEEERSNIERLQEEMRQIARNRSTSASSSGTDHVADSEHESEEERLLNVANKLKEENKRLENEGDILVNAICTERELCIQLRSKVQLGEKDNRWIT